jgi:hypothetical protein
VRGWGPGRARRLLISFVFGVSSAGGGFYSWGYQFGNGNAQEIVQVINSPSVTLYSLNTYGSVMMEVGDVSIAANTTTDQAPFCSTVIAILNE